MKIARIETFLVPPRWLFCRVETDTGIVGWGEPVVEGRAEAVRAAIDTFAEYLVGRSATRIEDHWQVLTKGGFYRGGPVLSSAVAGIDQALWDIAGKRHGVPVHELVGGPVRDRVRIYTWVGGDDPSNIEDAVAAQVEAGLTAVKMNGSGVMSPHATPAELDAVVARVAAARSVLGPDRDIAIDFHGRVSLANARRILPRIEEFAPLFVEEPLVPEQTHLLAHVTSCSSVPVATGERLYTRADFRPALEAGIAVAQPDLSHAGGFTEARRIAAVADMYGAAMAPHSPLGPIALAASLQLAFCTPNFLIQEQSLDIHYNGANELLDLVLDTDVFRVVDGHLERLTGPGLGVTIDEAAVRRADKVGHRWRSPIWRHRDGSFAEW